MSHATKNVFCLFLALVPGGLSSGCKDPARTPAPAGAPGPATQSAEPKLNPENTILSLRNAYQQRQYAKMTPWVSPKHADGLFRLLAGTDRLAAANLRVQGIIQQKLGYVTSDRWDLAAVQENLGIFSEGVRIVDTTVIGDRATVAYQIKGILPLSSAGLVRQDGAWRYLPEIHAELPEQINQLADSLERLGDAVADREELSPDQVDAEYRYRIVPRIERLAALDPE